MELDRNFPKVIALDDKQSNIFLINAEYTWIPTMCERCENLRHKVKRFLLPSTTTHVPVSLSLTSENTSEIHVLDIDIVLLQTDKAHHIEIGPHSSLEPIPVLSPTLVHSDHHPSVPSDTTVLAQSPSSTPQRENFAATLSSSNTLPKLVDPQSIPIATPIMEFLHQVLSMLRFKKLLLLIP